MKPCVLDTNVVSLILRNAPQATPYLQYLEGVERILSFQTIAEMRFGSRTGKWGYFRKQNLESFLRAQTVVTYTDELAHNWALVMHEARRAGRRLEAGDAWIAATALLLNIPLLTHDRDFDVSSCPSIEVIRFA